MMDKMIWAALVLVLVGCGGAEDHGEDVESNNARMGQGGKSDALGDDFEPPVAPHIGGTGAAAAWGGPMAEMHAPEAIFANAVSGALGAAWTRSDTRDAVAAVPVQIFDSNLNPYGDGQSNAAAGFGSWGASRPPVVGTWIQDRTGAESVVLRLDRALPVGNARIEVTWAGGVVVLDGAVEETGDKVAEWTVPDGVTWDGAAVIWVRPEGWGDGWPLHFYFPVQTIDDAVGSMPEAVRSFDDGRTIPDPEDVSSQTRMGSDETAFDRLMAGDFGAGFNVVPFEADDIHGSYPHRHNQATAVGRSWAWVVDEPVAPFKQVYLCMEGRDVVKELQQGVPTGSGWHKIGDPAESVLNSLESEPMLSAWARRNPSMGSGVVSGGFAYGLGDVATARWLRPGESFVTRKGAPGQDEFHWYAVHGQKETCVEIWVHPCGDGTFDCKAPAQGSARFEVGGAETVFGQDVYVVGGAPELGQWDPAKAVKMTPTDYPTWSVDVALAPGTTVAYKYIKRDGAGNTLWESGPDRAWTVPTQGGVVEDVWR